MHHFARAVGILVPAVALTAGGFSAADAQSVPTFELRWDQIALVEDAVPLAQSPVSEIGAGGDLVLDAGGSTIGITLPVDGDSRVGHSEGRSVLSAGDAAHVAVGPTPTGAQVLVGIESADAPTSYEFGLDAPADVTAELTVAGAIDVVDASGGLSAQIEAPWAIDAEGRAVPTRFEVNGDTVTQVVDHRGGDYAYPIVADPKVKFCDLYTAACVTFSKAETKSVAKNLSSSVAAGVSTICGKIPASNAPGLAVRGICVAAVNVYFKAVKKAFVKAKKAGRCTELKFRIVGPPIVTAKVVSC